jgi:hypothetical protein
MNYVRFDFVGNLQDEIGGDLLVFPGVIHPFETEVGFRAADVFAKT